MNDLKRMIECAERIEDRFIHIEYDLFDKFLKNFMTYKFDDCYFSSKNGKISIYPNDKNNETIHFLRPKPKQDDFHFKIDPIIILEAIVKNFDYSEIIEELYDHEIEKIEQEKKKWKKKLFNIIEQL